MLCRASTHFRTDDERGDEGEGGRQRIRRRKGNQREQPQQQQQQGAIADCVRVCECRYCVYVSFFVAAIHHQRPAARE